MRLQRLMDYRFLQCLLLCLPLVTIASRAIRADWSDIGAMSTGNRGTRAGSGSSVGETVCMNFGLQRHLGSVPPGEILVQWFLDDPFCSDGLGLPLVLEVFYRLRSGSGLVGDWRHLQTISSELPEVSACSVCAPLGERGTQLAILQLDHAGGNCDNWGISNDAGGIQITVDGQEIADSPVLANQLSCAQSMHEDSTINAYIRESASSLRGLVTHWILHNEIELCEVTSQNVEDVFSLPDLPPLQLCSSSSPSLPHIDLSFRIHFTYDATCDELDFESEGIELSARREGDLLWRPIAYFMPKFYSTTSGHPEIQLRFSGDCDDSGSCNLNLRGYDVPHIIISNVDMQHHVKFSICDSSLLESSAVQFRWLQTVVQNTGDITPRDRWSLDDVMLTASYDNKCSGVRLFYENFESGKFSHVRWSGQRRGKIDRDADICNQGRSGSAAWFSHFTAIEVQSRMLATAGLNLHHNAVCAGIQLDPELSVIYNLLHTDLPAGVAELQDYVENNVAVLNETQVVFLTSVILDLFGNQTVSEELSQGYVAVAGALTDAVSSRENTSSSSLEGSTLLRNLDQFALQNHNSSLTHVSADSLELTVMSGGEVMVIDDRQGLSLTLPSFLFQQNNETVYAGSFLFRNMSGFLDNSLHGDQRGNESSLLGPVLSSFLFSGDQRLLSTSNLPPSNPVRISFPFPDNETATPTCVFWQFNQQTGEFTGGSWNATGCVTSRDDSKIMCECTHLTHFAVLLSPGIEIDDEVALSLQVIGIVGVSISLVALTLTIFTFIVFRSLWSMRNYVHIQLCASLFVAQLIFVAGVEPRGSEAACSVVAVLLHYAFLVSFMWMLMEGVVLYVALVRVFVEHHLLYIIAFTVASYGVPLLYMVLCIPLGLALKDSEGKGHYGSGEACWLRYDTHFVWAFIVPVLLIIIANIGFFIMALVIMFRHMRRQTHQTKIQQFKHWLKVSVSLLVIMGIAWAMGVLVFTKSLLPVAYIFTIFVAFQGLIIFILLVVLSKQVRDTYSKWWKVRVVNSEFLSRHFSQRTTRTTMTNSRNSDGSQIVKNRTESEASNGRHDSAAVMLKPSEALSSQSVSSSKHTGDDALSAV